MIKLVLVALVSMLISPQVFSANKNEHTTIFVANKIITMDPSNSEATAVAVKDQRIYSVGTLESMQTWMKPGTFTVNTQFANATITPGMIEAHSHWSMLIMLLAQPYVGFYDALGYNAAVLPGIPTKAGVITALKAEEKKLTDPNAVLFAWGYDPSLLNNNELTAADLDAISSTRPIFVLNASGHIGYANTVILNKAGYTAATQTPGVMKNKDGKLSGVLMEMAAMEPALLPFLPAFFTPDRVKTGIAGTGALAQRVGLTTASDLFFGGGTEATILPALQQAAADPSYPVRVVAIYGAPIITEMEQRVPGSGMAHLKALTQSSTDKLRFSGVKFVSDGSIQGFTARINWPGYFDGHSNGIFNISTQDLKAQALPFWQAGYPIHVHVNGNEATDSALDTLEYLQTQAPRRNPLFVLEHDQMSSTEQFKRAKSLGASVNLFSNQIYYWGDFHKTNTLGPDRASAMDNAAEAKRAGLIYSFHSDAPITPLGPLHSMWAAVNRMTASGAVLGTDARISTEDALRAVTIHAAYLLGFEKDLGSIEIGKQADFTVLARNPLVEPPQSLKDIPVVATVQGGIVHTNP